MIRILLQVCTSSPRSLGANAVVTSSWAPKWSHTHLATNKTRHITKGNDVKMLYVYEHFSRLLKSFQSTMLTNSSILTYLHMQASVSIQEGSALSTWCMRGFWEVI